MITTILPTRSFTSSVLDYNEGKVASYEAALVYSMNLEETHPSALYKVFEKLENNPRIQPSRTRSFHMAVNPGPDDTIDEEGVKRYVEDLMQYLGYGEQPVVVYRHNDIGRIHYHVVTSRFNAEGKKINGFIEGRRIKEFNLAFGEKYGFSVGAKKDGPDLPVGGPVVFDKYSSRYILQLNRALSEALKYPVTSRSQFQFLLRTMNVKCMFRQRKDGGYNTVLAGLDAKGKVVTRYYSMEKTWNRQAFDELNGRITEQKRMEKEGAVLSEKENVALVEMKAKVDFCLLHSKSMKDFIAHLKGLGLNAAAQRDADGNIQRVLVSDPEHHFLLDTAGGANRMAVSAFREAESSGRWTRPAPEKGSVVIKALKFPAAVMEELVRFIQRKVAEFKQRNSRGAAGTSSGKISSSASLGRKL